MRCPDADNRGHLRLGTPDGGEEITQFSAVHQFLSRVHPRLFGIGGSPAGPDEERRSL